MNNSNNIYGNNSNKNSCSDNDKVNNNNEVISNSDIHNNNETSPNKRSKLFLFVSVGILTDGIMKKKKDSIEYFIAIYKLLFLCFQETGNGSGLKKNNPYRVTLPNYKHFFLKKQMILYLEKDDYI